MASMCGQLTGKTPCIMAKQTLPPKCCILSVLVIPVAECRGRVWRLSARPHSDRAPHPPQPVESINPPPPRNLYSPRPSECFAKICTPLQPCASRQNRLKTHSWNTIVKVIYLKNESIVVCFFTLPRPGRGMGHSS